MGNGFIPSSRQGSRRYARENRAEEDDSTNGEKAESKERNERGLLPYGQEGTAGRRRELGEPRIRRAKSWERDKGRGLAFIG